MTDKAMKLVDGPSCYGSPEGQHADAVYFLFTTSYNIADRIRRGLLHTADF